MQWSSPPGPGHKAPTTAAKPRRLPAASLGLLRSGPEDLGRWRGFLLCCDKAAAGRDAPASQAFLLIGGWRPRPPCSGPGGGGAAAAAARGWAGLSLGTSRGRGQLDPPRPTPARACPVWLESGCAVRGRGRGRGTLHWVRGTLGLPSLSQDATAEPHQPRREEEDDLASVAAGDAGRGRRSVARREQPALRRAQDPEPGSDGKRPRPSADCHDPDGCLCLQAHSPAVVQEACLWEG